MPVRSSTRDGGRRPWCRAEQGTRIREQPAASGEPEADQEGRRRPGRAVGAPRSLVRLIRMEFYLEGSSESLRHGTWSAWSSALEEASGSTWVQPWGVLTFILLL